MYKLIKVSENFGPVNSIIRVSDGASIPFDDSNKDYQAYLKWLDGYELQGPQWVKTSEGNTPLPADEA